MISIVIPVYNTEHYIGQCLESILDSAYQEFEIILVNDGSSDCSLQVCQKYSQKDDRIRIINQEHTGVSDARNKGIAACIGEWVVFVDADDIISKDFLQMIAKNEYSDQDLLLFDYQTIKDKSNIDEVIDVNGHLMSLQYGKEDREFLISKLLNIDQIVKNGNTNLLSPWSKAYKRAIIEQYLIRFPSDIIIGEDRLFNIEYLLRMKSCTYVSKTVYYNRVRMDSLMHGFHQNFLMNDYRYQEILNQILVDNHIFVNVKNAYYNNVLCSMADVLIRGIFNPHSCRPYRENISLCREMHCYGIYSRALDYNRSMGIFPRRMLLFFFKIKCYFIVGLICKLSYKVLEQTDRL